MWHMSSVFSHESAQRNNAGHLIDKMYLKQHGHANANKPFKLSNTKRTTGGGHLEKDGRRQ